MAPLVRSAWKAFKLAGAHAGHTDLSGWAPDHPPWAIFMVDGSATVVKMNAAATTLLAGGDAVSLDDGVLRPLDGRSAEDLNQVLHRGLAGHCAETLMHCAAGRPPLIAQIIPINPARVPSSSRAVAILYIWNPVRRSDRVGDVLARLYGFTQAEAHLVPMLCRGIELSHAAEQLGISRNTAHN